MVPHSFHVFFPNQLCRSGFYVTFNVVKLMFIAFFFYFMWITMMVFNVCVNDTFVPLYKKDVNLSKGW